MIKKALRQTLRRLEVFILKITSPLWVRLFKFITKTGSGTDTCMRYGFLPLPINYHSPVPDLNDLDQRQVWNKKSDLAGIDFHPDQQVRLLRELGENLAANATGPLRRQAGHWSFTRKTIRSVSAAPPVCIPWFAASSPREFLRSAPATHR
jgi:hypothetical protein